MLRVAIVNQSKVPSSTATCLWETASSHNHIATACCSRTSRPKIILFSGSWLMAFSSANFPYLSLTQGQLSPFTASHSKSFLWFPDTLCKGILSPVCFGSSLFFSHKVLLRILGYLVILLWTFSSFAILSLRWRARNIQNYTYGKDTL